MILFHFHIADIKQSEIIFSVQTLSLFREYSSILSLKYEVALRALWLKKSQQQKVGQLSRGSKEMD